MNKELIYIGFYDHSESEFKRASNLSAINKIDYISDALNRAGYSVHIVSPSWFDDSASEAKYHSQIMLQLNENKRLTLCPSIGTTSKWSRNIKIVFSLTWLFFWILYHVSQNNIVLMYHTPWLSIPVRMAKMLKGFNLILEVEEVYGDVSSLHPYFDKMENKLFLAADAYLFATELLAERICKNKPFIIIYGIYYYYEKYGEPPEDGKIHLLYAGIIDSHKNGAFNALEATKYLSQDYLLHIIGFGETGKLIEQIEKLNRRNSCKIVFDGVKSGNELIHYSQSCHIGLNTQRMNGRYLNSSFPSKILSYLAMNLQVVSCYIECVAKSKIHPLMNYYVMDNPEEIAKAIKSVNVNEKKESGVLIRALDKLFVEELKKLLNKKIK